MSFFSSIASFHIILLIVVIIYIFFTDQYVLQYSNALILCSCKKGVLHKLQGYHFGSQLHTQYPIATNTLMVYQTTTPSTKKWAFLAFCTTGLSIAHLLWLFVEHRLNCVFCNYRSAATVKFPNYCTIKCFFNGSYLHEQTKCNHYLKHKNTSHVSSCICKYVCSHDCMRNFDPRFYNYSAYPV